MESGPTLMWDLEKVDKIVLDFENFDNTRG